MVEGLPLCTSLSTNQPQETPGHGPEGMGMDNPKTLPEHPTIPVSGSPRRAESWHRLLQHPALVPGISCVQGASIATSGILHRAAGLGFIGDMLSTDACTLTQLGGCWSRVVIQCWLHPAIFQNDRVHVGHLPS